MCSGINLLVALQVAAAHPVAVDGDDEEDDDDGGTSEVSSPLLCASKACQAQYAFKVSFW